MKQRLYKAVCLLFSVSILTSCSGQSSQQPPVSGIENTQPSKETQNVSSEEDIGETSVNETSSGEMEETNETIAFNTDTPGENLKVEAESIIGKTILVRLTNDSDVCYESIGYQFCFKTHGLGSYGIESETANSTGSFYNIPSHSVTYKLLSVPGYYSYMDKEGGDEDIFYYLPMTMEDIVSLDVTDFKVSEYLIQDVSEYLAIHQDDPAQSDQLGTIENTSNEPVYCEVAAILDESLIVTGNYGNPLEPGKTVAMNAWLVADPVAFDGMTVGEINEYYKNRPPLDMDSYGSCRFVILRAFFESQMYF